MTLLDEAGAAMTAGGEAAALQFYHVLADTLLLVLLSRPASEGELAPKIFDLPDGPVLLAFDCEERLADFDAAPQPYAALPGRIVAQHLAGQGISLGLNFGSGAASEILLPADAMLWLTEMLEPKPARRATGAARFSPAARPPEALMTALFRSLEHAAGRAAGAVLVHAHYPDGGRGDVLAIIDASQEAHDALARAVSEALAFSGVAAAALDVTFLGTTDPVLALMRESGVWFDFPAPPAPQRAGAPLPPGMDPARPPRLR